MITWSEDVNLNRICKDLNKGVSRFKMRDYHIYGLRQEDRPHVRISPECPLQLKVLFLKSGYKLEVVEENQRYHASCDANHSVGDCCCGVDGGCDYCNPNTINIGLRRDVRSDSKIARKLIKTIIFAVEGKLVLEAKSKLSLGRRVRKAVVQNPTKSEPKVKLENLPRADAVIQPFTAIANPDVSLPLPYFDIDPSQSEEKQ